MSIIRWSSCLARNLTEAAGRRWLRFRRYRGKQLVAFLPDGKVTFADREGEIVPRKPGFYLAAALDIRPTYAIARLIRAHRSLKFRRREAFGPTADGVSYLLSYHRSRRKRLPFVCDPQEERLALFGYDEFTTLRADGQWNYFAFRHGQWRLLNWHGPCKMPDDLFAEADRRVVEFERTSSRGYFGSPQSRWSAALTAGVVSKPEYGEAYRRSGPMWTYAGD
jgi:hypothetical protein